jgi:hypothetical protein
MRTGSSVRSAEYATDHIDYRSSLSRNKLVPVNVPDSRPSLSLVILRDTLDSVSRPPRKSQLLSELLSSSPS